MVFFFPFFFFFLVFVSLSILLVYRFNPSGGFSSMLKYLSKKNAKENFKVSLKKLARYVNDLVILNHFLLAFAIHNSFRTPTLVLFLTYSSEVLLSSDNVGPFYCFLYTL